MQVRTTYRLKLCQRRRRNSGRYKYETHESCPSFVCLSHQNERRSFVKTPCNWLKARAGAHGTETLNHAGNLFAYEMPLEHTRRHPGHLSGVMWTNERGGLRCLITEIWRSSAQHKRNDAKAAGTGP